MRPGDPSAFVDVRLEVVRTVEDERRDVDHRQHLADVDVSVHPQERSGSRWARTPAQVREQTSLELRVLGRARREDVEVHLPTPFALDEFDLARSILVSRRPRIVRCA